jgi:putative flippase GtrA
MNARKLLRTLLSHSLIRYLAVACFIVVIELIVFQLVYILTPNYVLGTVISFAVAVVLNWALSRKVVFGASQHSMIREFTYVSIVSIVGLGIQLAAVWFCVDKLHMYPLLGKILSILTSFFWNYWFRAHFIFDKTAKQDEEAVAERIDSSLY